MTGSASVTILLNLCTRVQQILHQKTTTETEMGG